MQVDNILENLNKCQNEDEVYICLIDLIKKTRFDVYKEVISNNPFYMSLLPEIKLDVLSEFDKIKNNIESEVELMQRDSFRDNTDNDIIDELIRNCKEYLYEINCRREELLSFK